jgi:hypothetical protein
LRDTRTILREADNTLDFGEPIAILLLGILHFISDSADAYEITRRLMDAVPSGSDPSMAASAQGFAGYTGYCGAGRKP